MYNKKTDEPICMLVRFFILSIPMQIQILPINHGDPFAHFFLDDFEMVLLFGGN